MRQNTQKKSPLVAVGSPKNVTSNLKKQLETRSGFGNAKSSITSWKGESKKSFKDCSALQITVDLEENSVSQGVASQIRQVKSREQKQPKKDEGSKPNKQNPMIVKSPTNAMLKARYPTTKDREDNKTQKFINGNDEKISKMFDRNLELEETISLLTKQKDKTNEILQQYKSQQQKLEKRLDDFKTIAQQNKRLIKQKSQNFNDNGSEIIRLKQQIQTLKSIQTPSKPSSEAIQKTNISTQIGIQTQIYPEQNEGRMENYKIEKMIQEMKRCFQVQLKAKEQLIDEQRELLHEQNMELNEFYERMENQKNYQNINTSTDKPQLEHLTNKSHLIEQLYDNQQLTGQVNALTQQLESLKVDLKTKQIYSKHFMENSNNNIIEEVKKLKEEVDKYKREMEKKQRNLDQRDGEVKELRRKVEQQEAILKNMKENKPRLIIK